MNRFNFEAHRKEMDSARRSIRRQVAAIQIFVLIMLVMMIIGASWLLLHPEALGAFFGRIVAGFGSEVHHG